VVRRKTARLMLPPSTIVFPVRKRHRGVENSIKEPEDDNHFKIAFERFYPLHCSSLEKWRFSRL
jgi:hypothetical protein